jgi:hypothetical protein
MSVPRGKSQPQLAPGVTNAAQSVIGLIVPSFALDMVGPQQPSPLPNRVRRHRRPPCGSILDNGSAMGARGVQQLRMTAIELQLAPIRSSVHIPVATLWAHFQGGDVNAGLTELEGAAKTMIDDLLWWTAALKAARATAS